VRVHTHQGASAGLCASRRARVHVGAATCAGRQAAPVVEYSSGLLRMMGRGVAHSWALEGAAASYCQAMAPARVRAGKAQHTAPMLGLSSAFECVGGSGVGVVKCACVSAACACARRCRPLWQAYGRWRQSGCTHTGVRDHPHARL